MRTRDSKGVFVDACLKLYPSVIPEANTMKFKLLHRFMTALNSLIAAKTPLNYHSNRVEPNMIINIPIHPYGNDQLKDPEKTVNSKRDILINFVRELDFDSTNRNLLWLLRSMKTLNYVPELAVAVTAPNFEGYCPDPPEKLQLKTPKNAIPTIKRVKSQHGDVITYIVDPYVTDYSLFCNLTKPFDEMGMCYNGLHLYEHLMTKGWEGLPGKDLVEMNGSTWPQGVCYVYTIHSTEESLKAHTEAWISYYLKSRKSGFWKNEGKDALVMEIQRTISETRNERTLASMGRSDVHAYDYAYDQSIFEYWSNQPFELLIVTPHEVYIPIKTSKPLNVKKPENIKFNHLPLDVIKTKKLQQLRIMKATKEEVKRTLTRPASRCTCGLDCLFDSLQEDLGIYTNVLHPLLFCNRLFTDEELKTFLRTRILPWSARLYTEACINTQFLSVWLDQQPDEDDY